MTIGLTSPSSLVDWMENVALLAASRPKIPFWAWTAFPILLGAWLRLRNIGEPEAFVDEGANILTALDLRVRDVFEPLAQGRPGLIWLFKPAGWMPAHTLAAARSMSAIAGLTTAITLGWILNQLAGRTSALCGMLLWDVMPLAVFHERLALQDPFFTTLLAGSLALVTAGSLKPVHHSSWLRRVRSRTDSFRYRLSAKNIRRTRTALARDRLSGNSPSRFASVDRSQSCANRHRCVVPAG